MASSISHEGTNAMMEGYDYILCADSRFIGRALAELAALSGGERVKSRYLTHSAYLVSSPAAPEVLLGRLKESDPTYIYTLMPVIAQDKFTDIEGLAKLVAGTLDRNATFRIEVIREDTESDSSAKTIEVETGTAVELEGYRANLLSPEDIRVLIMVGSRMTLAGGRANMLLDDVADYSRWGQKHTNIVNRAEMKIIEAFRHFHLEVSINTRCIDIGAAPGGWTRFLVGKGAKVVAVDAADLNYEAVGAEFEVVPPGGTVAGTGQVHLKMGFDKALPMLSGRFGFASIDMNVTPMESADAALKLAPFIEAGAPLLLTVKLQRMSDADKTADLVESLKGQYGKFRFKKLPHNRQEITMVAYRI